MTIKASCLRKIFWSLIIPGFFIAARAADLAPNAGSSGTLNASHTEDWWTITTTADGSLTVNIATADSSILEQDADLYDVDGTTRIAHDGSYGTKSTLSYPNLLPGHIRSRYIFIRASGPRIRSAILLRPNPSVTTPNRMIPWRRPRQ